MYIGYVDTLDTYPASYLHDIYARERPVHARGPDRPLQRTALARDSGAKRAV